MCILSARIVFVLYCFSWLSYILFLLHKQDVYIYIYIHPLLFSNTWSTKVTESCGVLIQTLGPSISIWIITDAVELSMLSSIHISFVEVVLTFKYKHLVLMCKHFWYQLQWPKIISLPPIKYYNYNRINIFPNSKLFRCLNNNKNNASCHVQDKFHLDYYLVMKSFG